MDASPAGLHGAYLRSELIAAHGKPWMKHAIASGRLRPLWRGVVVESARVADVWTRAAAALLTTDPRAVLMGQTAARLLELASPLAESAPESRLRMALIEHGFPVPAVNFWVHDIAGRRIWRVDLAWPSLRIAVEYDGYEAHIGREAEDAARAEDLRGRGWIIIRVDRHSIGDLHRVIRELEAAFAQRGYSWIRRDTAS